MNRTVLAAVRSAIGDQFDPEWVEEALIAADAVPVNDDIDVYMQAVETAVIAVFNARIAAMNARTDALNRQTDLMEAQLAIKRVEAIDASGPRRH